VVIKRSAGQEIRALVADLDADDEVRREAAIARLAVIGTRAVDRLVALLGDPSVGARAAVTALRTLESIGDNRALAPALALLESPNADVGTAAVAVLRTFLHTRHGTSVLDHLVACGLDPQRPDATRLAAVDAVGEMGGRVVTPVWERLRDDHSVAMRRRAAKAAGAVDPLADIEAASAGVLPDDPEALRVAVEKAAGTAPLTALHRLVGVVKTREKRERAGTTKAGWLTARGAVHLALAGRGSRVALYDLRETIAGAQAPLPRTFLAAVTSLGDAPALEAIAAAYARGTIAGGTEWLEQLKTAFRTIAEREHIGPRHPVMKRIEAKWPAAAELIEKRTTRRRQ
jgi:HEAT repeat protein